MTWRRPLQPKALHCFRDPRGLCASAWLGVFCPFPTPIRLSWETSSILSEFRPNMMRQHRDESRRGYFQQSLVVLSSQSWVGLFKDVLNIVSPVFFEHGAPVLESCMESILSWPPPSPGSSMKLPLLGTVMTFCIPSTTIVPLPMDAAEHEIVFLAGGRSCRANICGAFRENLHHLWFLWEMVLCGSNILVIGSTPEIASQAVHVLKEIISPLVYCGDYRPYFTIHDSDFRKYTSSDKEGSLKGLILGVTNPFFIKCLSHWPNIYSVGSFNEKKNRFLSKSPPLVSPNYKLLRRLKASPCPENSLAGAFNEELLCRHFLKITSSFLLPLERYFNSLMPLSREINSLSTPPRLKKFLEDEFLKTLSTQREHHVVKDRDKEVELYRRFFRGCNFDGWYSSRVYHARREFARLYAGVLIENGNSALANESCSQVVTVDTFMRASEFLRGQTSVLAEDDRRRLSEMLNRMTSLFPFLPAEPAAQ